MSTLHVQYGGQEYVTDGGHEYVTCMETVSSFKTLLISSSCRGLQSEIKALQGRN